MEAYETALIGRPRPFPRCHDSNANSMAANVDETQNASWRDIAKIKPV